MAELMTEQEVLEKLNVKDFRHMSKDKVIAAFSSMLPNMSSEVALKVLDQFPSYAQTMTEIAAQYKDVLVKSIESGSISTQQSIDICQAVIDALRSQLDKDDISFEERKFYVEQMQQTAHIVQEINAEHHSFLMKCFGYGILALIFVGCGLATALGINMDFLTPNRDHRVA